MDLISIIVAVYNAENTLEKCLNSLLEQTYKNTEIIVVNDCSKDNSLKICQELAAVHSNIVVISNEKNCGVSATRNRGIEASNGDFICFIDSDDYVDQNYLEVLHKYAVEYDTVPICGFVFHNIFENKPDQIYSWGNDSEKLQLGRIFELYKCVYLGALWNKLFDCNKVKSHNIKFDETLSLGEDLRFSLEYFEKNNLSYVYVLSDTLYHYLKLSDNTLMSKYSKSGIESGIENLRLTKDIAKKYNPKADALFEESVKTLKDNMIYFTMTDKKYSKKQKLEKIRELSPNFSNNDYIKMKISFVKEKIYDIIKG